MPPVMPVQTPEAPVTAGNGRPYPKGGTFAKLLDWHLDFGTRPKGSPSRAGKSWDNLEFAKAVGFTKSSAERSVRNWRAGREKPSKLVDVEAALFDENEAYLEWRIDLRKAYDAPARGAAVDDQRKEFRGRDAEVSLLAPMLAAGGAAILVQGPPGIGKSELTRAIANAPEVVAHFGAARRWFVKLQAVETAATLWYNLAEAVGADPKQSFDKTLDHLSRWPGLLVLDNLETPWGRQRAATERVLAELARLPGVGLLVSFRGRAKIEGPAWTHTHRVGRLPQPHDAEVFRAFANWDVAADPHHGPLLKVLGGVPLALRLIGLRAHTRDTLAPIWSDWQARGALVAVEAGGEEDPLKSLACSIEISLKSERMTAAAVRLFALLGALPAGLGPLDRQALFGEGLLDAEDALLGLGLAEARDGRLDLLAPIREYARVQRKPTDEDADRWRRHYLRLAREIGGSLGTKAGFGGMARLAPEFANMSAALGACIPDKLDEAVAALPGFGRFASLGGRPAPILPALAEACGSAGYIAGRASCLVRVGDIALARSDHAAARTAYETATPLYRNVGDVLGGANCIKSLGDIALERSDHDAARTAYETATPLYRSVGDVLGEANCIKSLGDIALRRSDHDAARRAYETAAPLYQSVGDVLGEANCIQSLGDIALRRSDHDAARKAYETAMPLHQSVGDVLGEANCMFSLGVVALERSDYDAARKAYETATPLYQSVGAVLGEANCIRSLGDIALARSDHAAARKAYETATPLYQTVGDVLGEANCMFRLGVVALARSDHAAARKAYETALPMYVRVGDLLGEGNCHEGFGDVARAQGDFAAARAAYETAGERFTRFGDPVSLARAQAELDALASGGEAGL